MGLRGPKPTPTPILKARGSRLAAKRSDATMPLFPLEAPSCPAWLPAEAKAEWRRTVKQLADARILAKVNRAVLAAYCVCWSRWIDAEAKVIADGPILTSEMGGLYQNPWLAVANSARQEMVRLAAEFGMTPASAGRIAPAPQEDDHEDEKAKFFRAREGA